MTHACALRFAFLSLIQRCLGSPQDVCCTTTLSWQGDPLRVPVASPRLLVLPQAPCHFRTSKTFRRFITRRNFSLSSNKLLTEISFGAVPPAPSRAEACGIDKMTVSTFGGPSVIFSIPCPGPSFGMVRPLIALPPFFCGCHWVACATQFFNRKEKSRRRMIMRTIEEMVHQEVHYNVSVLIVI